MGWQEWLLIAIIVLVLFGAKRIPELARALGKANREFKKAKNEIMDYSEKVVTAAEKDAEQEEKGDSQSTSDAENSDDTDKPA